MQVAIEQTWDGQPVTHDPIEIRLEGCCKERRRGVVSVVIKAPLFDDPDPPPLLPGVCPGLWEYEVVELFFANEKAQYLEVEVGPHGHWLCILHDGVRRPFNTGEQLHLDVTNTLDGDTWHCSFQIPLPFFPPGVQAMNAYAIHGSGDSRVYEAWAPVTDGSYGEPDFHRLQFFKRVDMQPLILDTDVHHGDLWKGHQS